MAKKTVKKTTRKAKKKNIKIDIPLKEDGLDGKDDTTLVDEVKAQIERATGQKESQVQQPNEGADGSSFRDFLKKGDLARGQSEDDLTDKQREVLVDRQLAFQTEQKSQTETAEKAQDSAVGDPGGQTDQVGSGDDKQDQIIRLLTDLNGFIEAISINVASMAAKAEISSDNAVRLGAK